MKFKFPRQVLIGSTKLKITYDKRSEGGSFDYADNTIIIGTKNISNNKGRFLEIIIHELKEVIQTEQYTRYYRNDEESYMFFSNHAQHTQLCGILAGLLDKFIV